MLKTDIKIRQMQLGDLTEAIRLKNNEGWNQLEKDWELLIKLAPDTCFVAEYKNKIIGTVTAIIYSNKLAWIGMMLVDQQFRKKGVGWLLLTTILEKLGKNHSIKLDATPNGFHLYKKLGFIEEYTIHRLTIPCIAKQPADKVKYFPSIITTQDIPKISRFDEKIFGANRTTLIQSLIETYPDRAWVLKSDAQISVIPQLLVK